MYGNNKATVSPSYNSPDAGELRQTEVNAAVGRAESNYEYLAAKLDLLATRLSPVLNNTGSGAEKIPTPAYSCDLACRIGALADRISSLSSAVDEAIGRLEI